MIGFNPSIHENWKSRGYRYIFVLPLEKFGVLQPLTSEKERRKGFTINIDELDLIDLSVDYFLTKEKDGVLQYA